MCQIGVMTGYRLESIRFELRCVSGWCDDWLQVAEHKVTTVVVSHWCDDWLQAGKYKV